LLDCVADESRDVDCKCFNLGQYWYFFSIFQTTLCSQNKLLIT
jgi:hypothetical protein